MQITSNAGYKGTAFGDPARSLTQNTTNQSSKQLTQATAGKLNSPQTIASPAGYKGTALGDPAKYNSAKSVTYDKNSSKLAAEAKGNKLDISL